MGRGGDGREKEGRIEKRMDKGKEGTGTPCVWRSRDEEV